MTKKKPLPTSESWLQKAVIDLAHTLGWKVMHQVPAQTRSGWATTTQGDGKGFPDLVLVRERIVFAELKADGKYLSVDQKMWRDWIERAGGEWYCWKTLQWVDGTIDRILTNRSPVAEVTDQARFERLLAACDGNEEQARNVYAALDTLLAP